MEKKTVYTVVAVIVAAILLVVGFVLLKQHKDRVAPTPPPVVEVQVEEPVEEEPQPKARRRRDVSSSISRVVPVQNNQVQGMPTREEAVDAARDIFLYGNLDLPENILFFCAAKLGKNWGGRRFYRNIGGNLFFYGNVD